MHRYVCIVLLTDIYPLQVKNNAFLFDEKLHEFRITDSLPIKKEKRNSIFVTKDVLEQVPNPSITSLNPFECVLESKENPSHVASGESEKSGETIFNGKSELMESLISKSGSESNPTYSCRVPGCLFSVRKSLLCIKGHILAEHWSNVSKQLMPACGFNMQIEKKCDKTLSASQ